MKMLLIQKKRVVFNVKSSQVMLECCHLLSPHVESNSDSFPYLTLDLCSMSVFLVLTSHKSQRERERSQQVPEIGCADKRDAMQVHRIYGTNVKRFLVEFDVDICCHRGQMTRLEVRGSVMAVGFPLKCHK